MSGPKVVRIVTREEMIARCETQLAGVEQAMRTWVEVCELHQCATENEVAATRAKMNRLRDLIRRDQFAAFGEQARTEVGYLQDDQRRRMAVVVERKAAERVAVGRRRDAAGSLASALKAKGIAPPQALETALASKSAVIDDAALRAGFALLYAQPESRTDERSALARRLKGDDQVEAFDQWLSRLPAPNTDKRIGQIGSGIGELTSLADLEGAAAFETRLDLTLKSANTDLMLDSLVIDLSERLTSTRARGLALQAFAVAAAELRSAGLDVAAFEARAGSASASEVDMIRREMGEALASQQSAVAAASRRRAVLEGLAGLGYEVSEGLETAWVEQGKVVLRSTKRPLYGVEVSGNLSAERAQIRAVAIVDAANSADPASDRDAETIWCSEVSQLQDHMAGHGGALLIEKALAIGATPLKRIDVAETDDRRTAGRSRPRERGMT